MRQSSVAAGMALMLFASVAASDRVSAAPVPAAGLKQAMETSSLIEKTQYFWGGRNYCWYPNGWRGPGWYWCGYAFRPGWGWGGGYGWRGWGGGQRWHGGYRGGWHGGHGGGHGGHGHH